MELQNSSKEPATEKIKKGSNDLFSGISEFLYDWFELRTDLDKEGTIISIKNNKRMRGANAWLLMCSIMVASLGLNLNSPAVIIGAMLISPLMSPILGIGLSIGINDRAGIWVALQHFAMSIAIALVTSILYFSLTPLNEYTSEIAARTEPTFLDVLVAIFGGLAGIISGSRKDKSNAIPGVAIATALMPPLCVTGYGIANGEWVIAFNSFYLFFMNSTFIALTTYLLVTFMNFPKKKYEARKERLRTQRILGAVALIMLIPSIYIFLGVLEKTQERQRITDYVTKEFPEGILRIENQPNSDSLDVKIFLLEDIDDASLQKYYEEFNKLACSANFSLIDAQESGISKDEFEQTTKNLQDSYLIQIEQEKKAIKSAKDKEIIHLKNQLDSLQRDTVIFKSAAAELKAIFPLLKEIRYAKMQTVDTDTSSSFPTFLVRWSKQKSARSRQRDEVRIGDFLRLREGLDTLEVIAF